MKTTIILLLSLIACASSLWAADMYVSPAGSDSNPGTLEKPFRTLADNPDYLASKRTHQLIFKDLVSRYHPVWQKQVNDGKPRLHELVFIGGPDKASLEVKGRAEVVIPADIWSIREAFKYLVIRGQVGGLKMSLRPSRGKMLFQKEARPNYVAIQTRDLNSQDGYTGTYTLTLHGKGRVESIGLWEKRGLSPVFDESIYLTPGSDRPVQSITINYDPTTLQAIEGSYRFDRRKWMRTYAAPNSDKSGFEATYRDQGFLPGRQMLKFAPTFERGYTHLVKANPLREDPKRPGYIPRGYFESVMEDQREIYDKIDYPWAMCFNNWPSFQSATHPKIKNKKGTPKQPYAAAADTVVQYLNAQIKARGKTAHWWEVKNESDVQSEWMWHWNKDYDGWKMLADFHNTVADAVHAGVEQKVLVCGPTSAHFHPEKGSFGNWRNQKRFMDLTKGHLDRISHHFYDSSQIDSHKRYRSGTYSGFIQGKFNATLDMVRAHQHAIDDVKPIIVTEYGVLSGGGRDVDHWRKIKTCSSILMQAMQRPEDLELAVPFILPHMSWEPENPSQLAVKVEGGYEQTKLAYFIRLWREFQGERIVARSPNPRIRVIGLRDGDTLYLALNNVTDQIHEVRLSSLVPVAVHGAWQRKCNYENGRLHYQDAIEIDPISDRISLGVEESTVITMKLKGPEPVAVLDQRSFYAHETALPTGGEHDLAILCKGLDLAKVKSARLRIGLHRKGSFDSEMAIRFNGKPYAVSLKEALKGIPEPFEPIEIPVDPKHLKKENLVGIHVQEIQGTISSVKLIIQTQE